MEITCDWVKGPFRKLWSLYLCRMQICKRLETQATSEEKQSFIKHLREETRIFLRDATQFDWLRGQNCLPIASNFKNLHEIDKQLIETYDMFQQDTEWEVEHPELAKFLMRNLVRIRFSLPLINSLYFLPNYSIFSP
ncbi:MAG: hypothetical protein R2822_04125 [Spirosomataceae bacterium]